MSLYIVDKKGKCGWIGVNTKYPKLSLVLNSRSEFLFKDGEVT